MAENKKDLPANSDMNPKRSDNLHRQQEEFDNLGEDELQRNQGRESEVKNDRKTEHMRDSQQGDERMIPETKGKDDRQRGRDQHPE